jgi:hypothetical protein
MTPDERTTEQVAGYREACTRIGELIRDYYHQPSVDDRSRAHGYACLAYVQSLLPDVAVGTVVPAPSRDGQRLVFDARDALQRFDSFLDDVSSGRRSLDYGELVDESARVSGALDRVLDVVDRVDVDNLSFRSSVELTRVRKEEADMYRQTCWICSKQDQVSNMVHQVVQFGKAGVGKSQLRWACKGHDTDQKSNKEIPSGT